MGAQQSSVSAEKLEEWEQICAAMAFEEAQAEREFDAQEGCCALRCYCMQQCAGKYCELPLRCCYHWSCAAACSLCSASCASCGISLPEILLVHHHTMLGSCARPLIPQLISPALPLVSRHTNVVPVSNPSPTRRYARLLPFLTSNLAEPETPWCVELHSRGCPHHVLLARITRCCSPTTGTSIAPSACASSDRPSLAPSSAATTCTPRIGSRQAAALSV